MMHIDDIQNIKKLNKIRIEEEKRKQENINKENADICFEIAIEEINKKLKDRYIGETLTLSINLEFFKNYHLRNQVFDLLIEKVQEYYEIRGWNISIEISVRSYLGQMTIRINENFWYKIKRFFRSLFPNLFPNTNLLND